MSNRKTSVGVACAPAARTSRPAARRAAHGVVDLHRQLLDTAFDLSVEYDTLPAGSVLRCFARAVHLARLKGVEGRPPPRGGPPDRRVEPAEPGGQGHPPGTHSRRAACHAPDPAPPGPAPQRCPAIACGT